MIKQIPIAVCALFLFTSCALFSGLRKQTFTVTQNGAAQTVRLLVPKRYQKINSHTDSAGNPVQTYYYKNGALLYVAYTTDTLARFQPIDTTKHNPLPHPYGGMMYKGLDSSGRFWREVRTDSFRFGYRFVPAATEYYFDSAVNYNSARRFK